jgi:hypothetical protein
MIQLHKMLRLVVVLFFVTLLGVPRLDLWLKLQDTEQLIAVGQLEHDKKRIELEQRYYEIELYRFNMQYPLKRKNQT